MKELAKAEQIKIAVKAIMEHRSELPSTESWLESLSYCKDDGQFHKVGAPICDAIVLPNCSLLFPNEPFKNMKTFLVEIGIPVNTVYHAAKTSHVFV